MNPDDLDPAMKARIEAEHAEETLQARAFGARPRPGRYHAYLDESENVQDQLSVVSVVLIPESFFYQLNRDINKLRAGIRKDLLKHSYPIFTDDMGSLNSAKGKSEAERLRLGGLPEIHAGHMWQGAGAYRKKGSPETMRLRNKWLRSVADVFREHKIYLMTGRFNGKLKPFTTADAKGVLDELYSGRDLSAKKVEETYNDVHFRLVLEMFIKLDSLAEVGIEIASITCDKGRRHELFSSFTGFETARQFGYWSNFPDPIFLESHEVNGLQLADFSAYFFMKGHSFRGDDSTFFYVGKALNNRKIRPITSAEEATPTTYRVNPRRTQALMYAAHAETALVHCGGADATLPERKRIAEAEVRRLLKWGQL